MNKLKKEERDLDILFICNSLNLGGAEKIMYEVVKDTKSFKREIICLTNNDPFYGNLLENEGIIINYFNLNNNAVEFLNNIKPPKLKFFEISTDVNNPAKNDPSIINPVK